METIEVVFIVNQNNNFPPEIFIKFKKKNPYKEKDLII